MFGRRRSETDLTTQSKHQPEDPRGQWDSATPNGIIPDLNKLCTGHILMNDALKMGKCL